MKLITLLSGGMDSATLLYKLRGEGHELHALSFDYGQRHFVEIEYAGQIASSINVPWNIASIGSLAPFLRGSSQTDPAIEVPEGHYTHESMKVTVVPNRNMIMAAVATALAVNKSFDGIAMAMHAGDHAIYPDCRPAFANALGQLLTTVHFTPLAFVAPFINMSKADIVTLGSALGVPYEYTWSCYKGLGVHCGKCGTCVERREAFEVAGVPDPTEYSDAAAA